jgi:hypothetical protein
MNKSTPKMLIPGAALLASVLLVAPASHGQALANLAGFARPMAAAPAPAIASFSPTSGPTGTEVVITGTGLTNANQVTFAGGEQAAYSVASDTQMSATVPQGAITGPITVATDEGSVTTAAPFTIQQSAN